MSETFIPAQVFHPTQYIADEAIARGWTIWDFVERIGTLNAPRDVLAWELYAACGPTDPLCHMDEHWAQDLSCVFGSSEEVWKNLASACKAYSDRVAPLDEAALEWYGLDEDAE